MNTLAGNVSQLPRMQPRRPVDCGRDSGSVKKRRPVDCDRDSESAKEAGGLWLWQWVSQEGRWTMIVTAGQSRRPVDCDRDSGQSRRPVDCNRYSGSVKKAGGL